MLVIRDAYVDDWDLFERGASSFASQANKGFELIDVEYTTYGLLPDLAKDETFLVAEYDGHSIGAIAGKKSHSPFNPKLTLLAELFWWVDEDFREGEVGLELLKEFEKRAKELGCVGCTMCLLSTSPKLDSYLKNFGYSVGETSYIKNWR